MINYKGCSEFATKGHLGSSGTQYGEEIEYCRIISWHT